MASLSSFAFGQVAESYSLSLKELFAARGLNDRSVGNALTIQSPRGGLWASGFSSEIRPAYFSISVANAGSELIQRSLRVTYDSTQKPEANFAACAAVGDCDSLAARKEGANYLVEHDGSTWSVRLSGSPCSDSGRCEFLIAAWSLEKRRHVGTSSWMGFPAIATIVDHPSGIVIYDTKAGVEWLAVDFKDGARENPTASLGDFLAAKLDGSGALSLRYSGGFVLIDVALGRLFVGNGSGLYCWSNSIDAASNAQAPDWLTIYTAVEAGPIRALSSTYGVWQSRMVVWQSRATVVDRGSTADVSLPGVVVEAWISDASRADVRLKTAQAGASTYWGYSAVAGRFDELESGVVSGSDGHQFVDSTSVSGDVLHVAILRQ